MSTEESTQETAEETTAAQSTDQAPYKHRIGLALSGGGFRASIFHLGVIRRLEELGIMEHVGVVSSVSGGSIVGAFYLCEMEKQLRESRIGDRPGANMGRVDRVELFERIAKKFLLAVDHNLRTQALIFTPRYHPLLFLKILAVGAFRKSARAELIQAEYDRYFFSGDTLDQLPVERPSDDAGDAEAIERAREQVECLTAEDRKREPFYGPRLVLNTTSLLTGDRKQFSRDTSSGIKDLKTPDRNALRLSQVVGASSGVPVLFPPTAIYGDLLVDGGVSDNQGVEELMDGSEDCDVLLVSDASGQLQCKHQMSTSDAKVYLRTFDILQFQVRNKLLQLLMYWGKPCVHTTGETEPKPTRYFAFIHLLVNLKGRIGRPPRVSTEILPALGKIRTDLDQFSPIECEALMYHGYTLIDAQLETYCCGFMQDHAAYMRSQNAPWPVPMRTPPLFRDSVQRALANESRHKARQDWDPVRVELEAGSNGLYVCRCWQKYKWMTSALGVVWVAVWLAQLVLLFGRGMWLVEGLSKYFEDAIKGDVPGVVRALVHWLDAHLQHGHEMPGADVLIQRAALLGSVLSSLLHSAVELAATAAGILLAGYVAAYPVYAMLRRLAMRRDRIRYRKIAGENYSVNWPATEETHRPSRHAGQIQP